MTLFSRSPAEGLWSEGAGQGVTHDRVITVEVMAEAIGPSWWAEYREELQERFSEEETLIRSHVVARRQEKPSSSRWVEGGGELKANR